MNGIIKETSICRIHEGRPVQFPFFGLFGGVTLTKDHLIIVPVIRTPRYYFIRLLVLAGIVTILAGLSILIGAIFSRLVLPHPVILLPFAIVVLVGINGKVLLSYIRKRMGNEEDCLMIPVRSIKKVDIRRAASWNYIRVSYEVERGLCNDASFVVLSRWGLSLKKTQMAWACAIKEAMIAAGGGK